ncbi:hypothetical protein, partial [Mycolicibacterium fortuitum]|uniref:hypothetical protein n=1 Tax=Mycolicibacterium fortuitum TaxID=1766 RepID=UPI0026230052
LVGKLAEGSASRNHLEASIEARVIRLSYENILNGAFSSLRTFFIAFVVMGGGITTGIALSSPSGERGTAISASLTVWGIGFVAVELLVFACAWFDLRAVNKDREEYFASGRYPNMFAFGRPRWSDGLRGAITKFIRVCRSTWHLPWRWLGAIKKPTVS